ncbi:serine hydrolase domain-containing protein [Actinophytocola sp.]|uniref:serine hydrolase domain-containing protein n=1 Tax=Actinophytocola sp. TaxID=1872138 RepID=UPI0038999709
MTYRPSRRTALGIAGAAAATGAIATFAGSGAVAASGRTGGIPAGLEPGGELDRLAADLAAKDQFSGSFLLTYHGRPVLARSYGMANKALSVRNGPDTRFGLASVTKLLTGIAIAQLAQDRAIAYTDPLGRHVTGFPAEVADTVTIHHLLTHTSGLGDYVNTPAYRDNYLSWTTPDAVMNGITDVVRQSTPAFPPGAAHLYSNSAFHLLAVIVANVSGKSYFDYMREHVFQRAGMRDSGFYTTADWRNDRRIARPYAPPRSGGDRVDTLDEHVFIGTGCGGAFATCADMDRLARALLGNRLLTPAFTRLTLDAKLPADAGPPPGPPAGAPAGAPAAPTQPTAPRLGFKAYGGLASINDANQWSYGLSGGSTQGESTDYAIYAEQGWVCVVLGNYESGTAQLISSPARRLVNGG